MSRLLYLLIVVVFTNVVLSLRQPCAKGQGSNCEKGRFVKCGTITGKYRKFTPGNRSCIGHGHIDPYSNNKVIVQFTDRNGACTEILMYPGECWGKHYKNGRSYDCQGRCGAGCGREPVLFGIGGICSNWGSDCLRHDVCSYYFGSTEGKDDSDCGDEFKAAMDDTASSCASLQRDFCEASKPSVKDNTYGAICGIVRSNLLDSGEFSEDDDPNEVTSDEGAHVNTVIIGSVATLSLFGLGGAFVVMRKRRQSLREKSSSAQEVVVSSFSSSVNPSFRTI